MPKTARDEAYVLTVARKTAEKCGGVFPDNFKSFKLVCKNGRCAIGDMVAVKWGENDMTIGRVKRKHNRILVGIGMIGDDRDEPQEWAAWFAFSDVFPIVEVRASL